MLENTYAIIMAGGNGERFWPLSTPACPKQFLELFEGKALIRHAIDRLEGLIPHERIYVITAARLAMKTREALPMLPTENILEEPCRRDTAAAVAVACGLVLNKGGMDAVGCILTADHLISPVEAFQQTLADAVQMAGTERAIVTMGIVPTRPETGFGYIACGDGIESSLSTPFCHVSRFVEKPNQETAQSYLDEGNYYWNSGMFVWSAKTMLDAFAQQACDFVPMIESLAQTGDVSKILKVFYPGLHSISIDYAVMERCESILVARTTFKWDDVGSWNAIGNHFPQDENGNVAIGSVVSLDSSGNVLVETLPNHRIAVLGLTDVVVVSTPDAVLVCPKSKLKDLKKLVGQLT